MPKSRNQPSNRQEDTVMPNETALKFLNDKITALRVIQQELTRIYLSITDLNVADQFRSEISSLNLVLFALESARNSLQAAADPIPPPSDDRILALENALRQLDGYVRSDDNIHQALDFLMQIANLVNGS
jgi:hypothetical protein